MTTAVGPIEVRAPRINDRRIDAGSPAAVPAMVFKLVESAQARWRAVTAPHLVAVIRAGARFENSHLVERPEEPVAK